MKLVEARKYLHKSFKESFLKDYKNIKYGYVKYFNELYFKFGISLVNSDKSFPSIFGFSIGSVKVKLILEIVLPKKFRDIQENRYPVCMNYNQIRLFDEGKYPVLEYNIYNEIDAQKMVNEVSEYLLKEVVPEWEANPTNEYLEKKVNEKLSDSPNFSGLILAKLVNNPDFVRIKQHYLFVSQNWAEWDKRDLIKVIEFLENHDTNELLAIANGDDNK
jgi:hypothetical protein